MYILEYISKNSQNNSRILSLILYELITKNVPQTLNTIKILGETITLVLENQNN